ncbi:hypothetical protein ABK040_004593 [Willaertia magna]
MVWFQKTIPIKAPKRGCHLITKDILQHIQSDLSKINIGLCNLFIQHTSASLTINENYDKDVRYDLEQVLNHIVPENNENNKNNFPYKHSLEGKDDMPAHVKSTLIGCSINIPITKGKLNLGTWQGIYLNEHRDDPSVRNIVVTINGE